MFGIINRRIYYSRCIYPAYITQWYAFVFSYEIYIQFENRIYIHSKIVWFYDFMIEDFMCVIVGRRVSIAKPENIINDDKSKNGA